MNSRHDQEMESYLREFEPRTARSLELEPTSAQGHWRRLAAAAVVLLGMGISIWYVQEKTGGGIEMRERQFGTDNRVADKERNHWELTQLALSDPQAFDEFLTEQSRKVLPDLRGEQSMLGILARE